jgi:hypothetical protein
VVGHLTHKFKNKKVSALVHFLCEAHYENRGDFLRIENHIKKKRKKKKRKKTRGRGHKRTPKADAHLQRTRKKRKEQKLDRGDDISGPQKLLLLPKRKRRGKIQERGDHISRPQKLMLLSRIEIACGEQSKVAQLRLAKIEYITVYTALIGLCLLLNFRDLLRSLRPIKV